MVSTAQERLCPPYLAKAVCVDDENPLDFEAEFQIMTYLAIGLVIAALIVGVIAWRARRFERRFWRIVRANPDAAWVRFVSNAACFVDEDPGHGKYAGPYKFATTDGVEHSVYIFNDTIAEVYVKVARYLLDEDASQEARQMMRQTYEDDPRGAGSVEYRNIMRRFQNHG
jgi:hypothetical protein